MVLHDYGYSTNTALVQAALIVIAAAFRYAELTRSALALPSRVCQAMRGTEHDAHRWTEIAADIASEMRWRIPARLERSFTIREILLDSAALTLVQHGMSRIVWGNGRDEELLGTEQSATSNQHPASSKTLCDRSEQQSRMTAIYPVSRELPCARGGFMVHL